MFVAALTILDLVVAAAVFGLAMAVWTIAVLLWHLGQTARARKIEKRLAPPVQGGPARVLRLWHEGKETAASVPGAREKVTLSMRFERLGRAAGWVTPAKTVFTGIVGSAVFMFIVPYTVTGRVLAGACGTAAVLLVFWAYLTRQIARRVTMFEMQLVDALELASRSLRAGHPLLGAFRLIADEVPQPVGPTFAEICQQQVMGMSLEQAIKHVSDRSSSQDMKLFSTSVVIQLRSGGNLADMMERLALVIRDRIRLSRRVRVLTSQTQFGKRILIAMPFILFVVLNLINPSYMEPLYGSFLGQLLLASAGVALLLGIVVMNRMVRLK